MKMIFKILLFILPFNSVLCYNTTDYDCGIVIKMLEDNEVWNYFGLQNFDGNLIVFIDSSKCFKRCDSVYKGKDVIIINNLSQTKKEKQAWIEIFSIHEITKKKFKINIGLLRDGKYGYIIFFRNNGKIKIIEKQLGFFRITHNLPQVCNLWPNLALTIH